MTAAGKNDKEWLKRCIDNPDKYKIYVDNDDIFVVEITEEDPDGMEGSSYSFSEFGEEFIVWLLTQMGTNVDFV